MLADNRYDYLASACAVIHETCIAKNDATLQLYQSTWSLPTCNTSFVHNQSAEHVYAGTVHILRGWISRSLSLRYVIYSANLLKYSETNQPRLMTFITIKTVTYLLNICLTKCKIYNIYNVYYQEKRRIGYSINNISERM